MRMWIVLLLFACVTQAATLTGKITTTDGRPLAGANIIIQNTETGTTSNTSGQFTLEDIDNNATLVVSFIGYESQTVNVKDAEKNISIHLQPTVVQMGEVKVNSLRQKMQLKDVAMPINIVGTARIQQKMSTNISQAVQQEPGISLGHDGSWGTQVTIRGLSRNNIVMLVDGNRVDTAPDLAASFSLVDMNDIDRVEVVKGAASSLYGSGAIGGVVNVITKEGWYADEFYATGALSTGYLSANSSTQQSLRVNIGSKNWYLKVSGMLREAGNIQTPNGEIKNSQYSDNSISAKAGIRLHEKHEIKLNYQRYYAEDVGIPGAYPLFPATADVRYPEEERELASVEYVGTNLLNALPKLSLKVFQQDILRDVENIPYITNALPGKTINMLSVLPRATHKTNGAVFQTDWLLPLNQYLIVGIDAWQKDMDSFRTKNMRIDVLAEDGSVAKSINQTIAERPVPLASYRSIGVFAQDEIPLHDKLDLTLGGRWDQIYVENEEALNPVYTLVDGVKNEAPANQVTLWDAGNSTNQSWSANLGLLYHVLPKMDLSATVARSFRSPYLEERFQYIDLGSYVKIGDRDLEPENGFFTNLGARIWMDNVTITGDIFLNRIENMVIEKAGTYEGRDAFIKTNVGTAELYGFDLRADYRFAPRWNVFATAAWVDGRDTYLDVPLPLIPPLNGMLGISGPLTRYFNFEASATAFADQEELANWEIRTPGYVYVDFYLTSQVFHISTIPTRLFLGVENVTDRAFRNHLSTNRGLVSAEPGRNFMVRWQLGL